MNHNGFLLPTCLGLLLLGTSASRALSGENLIPNADFSKARGERPEGWSNPDPLAKYHLAAAGAGDYNSYAVGSFVAAQVAANLAEAVGQDIRTVSYRGNPAVGAWLTENYFSPGARFGWLELVEHATGEAFATRFWQEQFVPPSE